MKNIYLTHILTTTKTTKENKKMSKELLEKIYSLSIVNPENTNAKAYGITNNGGNMDSILVSNCADVYDLIDEIDADKLQANYNYFSILTTGWAAPLNEHGEIDGAPSEHKDRRRVTLVVGIDIDNKALVGSALKFDDDDEMVFDFGDATGSLATAILNLLEV
jgi:hypothetical protein